MKKFILLLCVVCSCVYLIGCDSTNESENNAEMIEPTTELVAEESVVEEVVEPTDEPTAPPPTDIPTEVPTAEPTMLPTLDVETLDLEGKVFYDEGDIDVSFYYPEEWTITVDEEKMRLYIQSVDGLSDKSVPMGSTDGMILIQPVSLAFVFTPNVYEKLPVFLLKDIGTRMGATDDDTTILQTPFELAIGNGMSGAQMAIQSAEGVTLDSGEPANTYGMLHVIDVNGIPYLLYGLSVKENKEDFTELVNEFLTTMQYSSVNTERREASK